MSGESRARRHHIVPQVIQRNFCNEQGKLWYSEKNGEGVFDKPQLRSPKGSFWKRDHYTVVLDDELSDEVEKKHYGNIDDFWGQLLPQVIPMLQGRSEVPLIS